MTHITPHGPRAHATDHSIRRYAERFLGAAVDETVKDDRKAVRMLRTRVNVGTIRARIADVGSVVLARGMTSGDVVAFPDGLRFRVVDGNVVTVLARVAKPKPTAPARCVLDMEYAS